MLNAEDSDARCLRAAALTLRFLVTGFLPLGLLLAGACLLSGKSHDTGVNMGVAVLVAYFTAAHNLYGRSRAVAQVIAGLACLGTQNAATGGQAAAFGIALNLPSDFTMANSARTAAIPVGGMVYAVTEAGDCSLLSDHDDDDDDGYWVNPGTGLPMMNSVVDVHGNIFGTCPADDVVHQDFSTHDDIAACSPSDDMHGTGMCEDDWWR